MARPGEPRREVMDLLPGETVLASRRVLYYHSRMLASEGRLHLTDRRFVFEPTGLLERSLGTPLVSLWLRDVERMTSPDDRHTKLVVWSGHEPFVFSDRKGLDAEFMTLARREVVDAQRPVEDEPPDEAMADAVAAVDGEVEELDRGVLILGDTDIYGVPLSTIVRGLKTRTTTCETPEEALALYRAEGDGLALVIVNLIDAHFGGRGFLEVVGEVELAEPPTLWTLEPLFEKSTEEQLERFGVSGLFDKSVGPNALADHINRLLRNEDTHSSRRHPRVATYFPVEYAEEGEEDHPTAYARGIGTGGLFLETVQPRELGTFLTVRFRVPHGETVVQAIAEVVYSQPPSQAGGGRAPGMGLKFRDIGEAEQEAIRRYIEEHIQHRVDEARVILGM